MLSNRISLLPLFRAVSESPEDSGCPQWLLISHCGALSSGNSLRGPDGPP